MQPIREVEASYTAIMAQMYKDYAPLILLSIRRYVAILSDAEDILLDVFLAMLENHNIQDWQGNERLSWLKRVAYNKCMDYHRARGRNNLFSLDNQLDESLLIGLKGEQPEEQTIKRETEQQMQAYLNQLPEYQQHVLQLRFGENMRCREIAKELDMNESTVRGWVARSLKALRALYMQAQKKGVK